MDKINRDMGGYYEELLRILHFLYHTSHWTRSSLVAIISVLSIV